jgi:hypothetical protein
MTLVVRSSKDPLILLFNNTMIKFSPDNIIIMSAAAFLIFFGALLISFPIWLYCKYQSPEDDMEEMSIINRL